MAGAVVDRRVDALVDRCYAGLASADLAGEVLRRLPGILPVAATFFATVDPTTLLFTSAVAQDPLGAATPLFLDNEFGHADVNKFAVLAGMADPISSLDRVTKGRRAESSRYREIMAPLGLGDELRAALIVRQRCWGVLCLHLEDAEAGFSEGDLGVVRRLAPHLAEGLRRSVIRDAGDAQAPGAPGMLVLDGDLNVVSVSQQAEWWLARMSGPLHGGLPVPVHAAAARLVGAEVRAGAEGEAEVGRDRPSAMVRFRTRDGYWLAVHATRLRGAAEAHIGVIIEPAGPSELGSLLLSAHGLTEAQSRVVALVLRGQSTREIVEHLHISANTVQEHLTSVFDAFGVRSRRELIATILGHGGQ
jgi:DNA-binding CsgD family transcriptional regulator